MVGGCLEDKKPHGTCEGLKDKSIQVRDGSKMVTYKLGGYSRIRP